MMLFWAGLRGAVGVALAAGITGDNADALRTTILVVVVLTVIIFGGTTARMLEVLGIRVGVEDEDASDDDDEWSAIPGGLALSMGPGSRRFAGQNGRGIYDENDEVDLHSPSDSPYLRPKDTPRRSGGGGPRPTFIATTKSSASRSGFSSNSEDSDDGEPLPAANAYDYGGDQTEHGQNGAETKPGMIFRDGQWFTALDERYLLPLFSNSVTARRHHARKAKRTSGRAGGGSGGNDSGEGTPRGDSFELNREEDADEVSSESGKNKFARTFR